MKLGKKNTLTLSRKLIAFHTVLDCVVEHKEVNPLYVTSIRFFFRPSKVACCFVLKKQILNPCVPQEDMLQNSILYA
jgi:hypothetical protein